MLFTLTQVIGAQEVIGDVSEAQLEQRAALVIAYGQQTIYKRGK